MRAAKKPGVRAAGLIAAALSIAALAACDQKALLERFSSPEDRALGVRVIGDLEKGREGDADLNTLLEPALRGQISGVLPRMRAALPPGAQPELVGAHLNVSANTSDGSRRDADLIWRLTGAGRKALVRMVITKIRGETRITSLYVRPEDVAPARSATSEGQTRT